MVFHEVLRPLASSRTLISISSLALAMGAYAILPVAKEYSQYRELGDSPSDVHAALSLALGWLLVFRTNAAYARWWEARSLWGTLVNTSRNLAIKFKALARLQPSDMEYIRDRLIAFPFALTSHLRKLPYDHPELIPPGTAHPPLEIVKQIYEWLAKRRQSMQVDGDELRILDVDLVKLMEVCGGCEKIARTPIVRSYRVFARQCITLFLLTFPWGIVQDFQWWTIPLTIVMAYFMLGMEIVAEHVEEPFGFDEDDLDLEGMSETIRASVEYVFPTVPNHSEETSVP